MARRIEQHNDAERKKARDAAMEWDVFISHASEDKDDFVRPLADHLQQSGLRVWFDEFTLTVGDSLRQSIDRGLAKSRFGIVVISPSFLQKDWPRRELDGLVAREINGVKVLLPVWHKISVVEVREHSPMLADRVAASSGKGIDHVASQLLQAIRKADAGSGIVEASAPIAGTAPPLLVMPTALTSVPRAELRCSFNMHDPGCVRRNTLCAEMFAVPGQATPVVRQSKCDWYRVKIEAIGSNIDGCRGRLLSVARGGGELLSGENPPLPFTHGAADGTTTIHEGVPEHLDLLAVFEDNRVMLAVLPKQRDHPSMTATLRLRVLANQSENGR